MVRPSTATSIVRKIYLASVGYGCRIVDTSYGLEVGTSNGQQLLLQYAFVLVRDRDVHPRKRL